jgi:hypothetical protein
MIKQYRKKPEVIEAVQFVYTKEGIEELRAFCAPYLLSTNKMRHIGAIGEAHIGKLANIGKLEDDHYKQVVHIAYEDDFIFKDPYGEFYLCKPSIFHATYEAV